MSAFAEFRAPSATYPLGEALAAHPEVSIEVEAVVPTGGSTHYVWIYGVGREDAVTALRSHSGVRDVKIVDELPDRFLVRFDWSSEQSPIFAGAREFDGRIVTVQGSGPALDFRIQFPDKDSLTAFYHACQERDLGIRLVQWYDQENPLEQEGLDISPKQREALEAAFQAGYFDIPRQVTLQQLAEELDVSEQGVSERLRRGLSAYLKATLNADNGGSESDPDR